MKKLLLLLATLGLFSFSCQDSQKGKSLKLAHGLDLSHPVHKAMLFMAEKLKEKSQGKVRIEVYPSQQLGSERQCLELLQIGSLDMTKVSGAVMENFAPKFQVLSLPYIFRDREHAYRVQDGELGKKLLTESEKYRLRGLIYFDAGYRSFYAKEAINTPEDLTNKKIRVQESPTAIALVKALGGSPTPISWGELYTALQQGVVDGAENNPPSFLTSRHYEVCKFYSLNEHTYVPDILVIGTPTWNNLSTEEQNWLSEAAEEAKNYQRKLWVEAETEALEKVKAAGVTVSYPDKSLFLARTQDLLNSYKGDREKYDLIQKIQALQ
ncbi:MAG: TRAP transporter substrate-binding protein [Bacteroidota bacterium]